MYPGETQGQIFHFPLGPRCAFQRLYVHHPTQWNLPLIELRKRCKQVLPAVYVRGQNAKALILPENWKQIGSV